LPFEKFYEKTNIKGVAPTAPPLSLACLAGSLLKKGKNLSEIKSIAYKDNGTIHVNKRKNL